MVADGGIKEGLHVGLEGFSYIRPDVVHHSEAFGGVLFNLGCKDFYPVNAFGYRISQLVSCGQRRYLPNINYIATVHHGIYTEHFPFRAQPDTPPYSFDNTWA